MEKKIIKYLKLIAIICVVILIIEIGYIAYCAFFKQEPSIYFDGINSLDYTNSGYVTVGSNNDNDMKLEKAKITRYDAKKEKKFEKLFNKGYNSAFFGVVKDEDDYVAVGSYEATEKEHEQSVRSALIAKFDKNGELLFDKDFQVLGDSKFSNVVVVDDGYIVCGQSVYENMTLGFSNKGGAFLVKYSKDGKEIWRSNYGGNKSAIYNDLIVVDSNIYAVGKDALNVGIISKYNLDGEHIGTTEYKYTDSLGFSSLVFMDDNLYVATAKEVGTDEKNDSEAMIVQYDMKLNYKKEIIYKGRGMERFNRIIKDDSDNFVVIGTMTSVNKENEIFNYDGIIGKYDKDLKKIDVITYGDEKDDYFTDIKLSDNGYLVIGYSSYEDGNYLSKFINYSEALKVLEVE